MLSLTPSASDFLRRLTDILSNVFSFFFFGIYNFRLKSGVNRTKSQICHFQFRLKFFFVPPFSSPNTLITELTRVASVIYGYMYAKTHTLGTPQATTGMPSQPPLIRPRLFGNKKVGTVSWFLFQNSTIFF